MMPRTDPFPEGMPERRRLTRRFETAAKSAAREVAGRLRDVPGLSRLSEAAGRPGTGEDHDVPGADAVRGTAFARSLWTALTAPPHARGVGSTLFGAQRPSLQWRWETALRKSGYTAAPPGQPLDTRELALVHGDIVVGLQQWPRRSGRQGVATVGRVVGSLAWVEPTGEQSARGGCGWTRLCVDTDQTKRWFSVLDNKHLDVAVLPLSEDRRDNAHELRAILPDGLPARVGAALVADRERPVQRLHLLGDGRVAVDGLRGHLVEVFDGVPHPMRGSLVVASGRPVRAEIWLIHRTNATAFLVDFFGDLLAN